MRSAALWLIALGLSLIFATRLGAAPERLPSFTTPAGPIESLSVEGQAGYFLSWFIIGALFLIVVLWGLRHRARGRTILFSFALVAGLDVAASAVFPEPFAFVLAAGLLAARLMWPYIWLHNLTFLFAVSGIAAWLGLTLSASAFAIILGALAIWDFVAIVLTRPVVAIIKTLAQDGLWFGLYVPVVTRGWTLRTRGATKNILMGGGDLALPAAFTVAALKEGTLLGMSIGIAAFVGFVSAIFMFAAMKRPIPALVPIGAATVLVYLLARPP